MREELIHTQPLIFAFRITPAHAGRIRALQSMVLLLEDHPRACGKNLNKSDYALRKSGSPPRMREEFESGLKTDTATRITPAHAGRIANVSLWIRYSLDHPRACGKNSNYLRFRTFILGSPPRMREEFQKPENQQGLFRITPAHAGRIVAAFHVFAEFEDHPRACGKNSFCRTFGTPRRGSPPRMREEFHRPCPQTAP